MHPTIVIDGRTVDLSSLKFSDSEIRQYYEGDGSNVRGIFQASAELYENTRIAFINGALAKQFDLLKLGKALTNEPSPENLRIYDQQGFLELKAKPENYNEAVSGPWGSRLAHYKRTDKNYVDYDGDGDKKIFRNGRVQDIIIQAREFGFAEKFIHGVVEGLQVVDGGQIGMALGSVLGRRLTDNVFGQIAASAVLGTVLGAIGEFIDEEVFGGHSSTDILGNGVDGFMSKLGDNLKSAGIGALSSYLTAELVSAVGLKGLPADFANSVGGAVVGKIISNITPGSGATSVLEGVNPALFASAIGSFIGTKLAAEVKAFKSVGGQIGSAVGAIYGGFAAASALSSMAAAAGQTLSAFVIANPVVAIAVVAVIVFIDTLLGGAIGSLFGGTPRSGADVEWDGRKNAFVTANVYAKKGGSKDAARSLSNSVAQSLNFVLGYTGSTLINPEQVQSGNYGMRTETYVYRPVSTRDKDAITARFKGKKGAEKLITHGTYLALSSMVDQLVGGDIYAKRALSASLVLAGGNPNSNAVGAAGDFNMTSLVGDLSIARDYQTYLANADAIGILVVLNSDSTFAAGWAATIARAHELNLHKRSYTDWLGGFNVFLDEAPDGAIGGNFTISSVITFGYDEAKRARYWSVAGENGDNVGFIEDTIEAYSATAITSGASSDTIDLRSGKLANQIGYTVNGHLNNDIAVSATDFTAHGATTVSFLAGQLRKTVSVTVANDGVAEAAEKFLGQLSNGSGVSVIGGAAEATIVNGSAALPTLLVGRSFARENDGYAVFRLSLSKAAGTAVSLDLALAALSATAGTDYGSTLQVSADGQSGWTTATSATFAAGVQELFVRVAVMTDNGVGADGKPTNVEGNERFTLTATVTAGASAIANTPDATSGLVAVSGTGTIVDATVSTQPLAWIDHVLVDEATGQVIFSVARSAAAAAGSVTFATADRRELLIDVAATVDAGAGDDTVHASNLGDNIFGGDGNDTLYGGQLDDWLIGGAGNDNLNAGSVTPGTLGGDGNYLDGGAGDDMLIGREGSDWLEGGDGTDTLEGGEGGDVLAGGGGLNDVMRGGRGDDQYIFRIGDVDDDSGAGSDTIRDESGLTIEQVVTQAYDDLSAPDLVTRIGEALSGTLFLSGRGLNNWRGGGIQVAPSGAAAGGDDALVFGPGIGIDDIKLIKSADGKDLIVELWPDGVYSGDRAVMKDWFSSFNKIEMLRFADGNEIRIADFDTFILGTDGTDTIVGTAGNDFVHAGGGNDLVYLLSGNDFGNGGLGDDTVSGDSGADIVVGAHGDDTLFGGYNHDSVSGGQGNDMLSGDDGNDILAGGAGDDEVIGGTGDDVFKFQRGDGRDTLIDGLTNEWDVVWISGQGAQSGYVVNPNGTITHPTYGTLFDGTNWTARTRYDIESGTLYRHRPANENAIVADTGVADRIEFGIGVDINDIQFQTAANGRDLIIGIEGSGSLVASFDSIADQIILKEWVSNPGARGSIESFSFFNVGMVNVANTELKGGTDGNDTLTAIAGKENWVTGGAGDDSITGAALNDILNGNSGQDSLKGEAGSDVLLGGLGDDTLIGGTGGTRDGQAAGDILIGGDGFDTASYETASSGVVASLGNPDINSGDAANDVYDSVEGLQGSNFNDTLEGDFGDNELRGGLGNDTLRGALGDDYYVFARGDGQDSISDQYVPERQVVVDAFGRLQGSYVSRLNLLDRSGGQYYFEHVVVDAETDEVLYRRALPATLNRDLATPPTFVQGDWIDGDLSFNGSEVAYSTVDGPGGDDTLLFEDITGNPGVSGDKTISLTDLSFAFDTGINANDLIITLIGTSETVRIKNFRNTGAATVNESQVIETIQFSDGSSVNLAGLKFDASGNLLAAGTDTQTAPVNDFIVHTTAATLSGGYGDDAILAGTGNNTLQGGDGDDLLVGGLGSDTLQGGIGSDTAGYVGSDVGITVNLASGSGVGGEAAGDSYNSVENVLGSQFNDTLTGNDSDNTLKGNRGNDLLSGGGGTSNVKGLGEDVLIGDDGDDTLTGGVHEDNLDGGASNDVLEGGGDRDVLAGGDGDDILRGDGSASGGTETGDEIGGNLLLNESFEIPIDGSEAAGWTSSSTQPVQFVNSGVSGLSGTRAVHLEDAIGNITLTQEIDDLSAGEGLTLQFLLAGKVAGISSTVEVLWNNEVIATYTNATTTLTNTQIDIPTAKVLEGTNSLSFRGMGTADGAGGVIDNVRLTRTGGGADQLIGGAGRDRLVGGGGNDVLIGGDGDDLATFNVTAGATAQTYAAGLYGGAGDDTLAGGAGNDTLDGGTGADKYLFGPDTGNDTVISGGGQDELIFDDIAHDRLWLRQVGSDLEITALGVGTTILVKNWFSGPANQARRIVTEAKSLARSDVHALVTAMAAVSASVPPGWPANPPQAFTDALAGWQSNDSYVDRTIYTGTTGNDTIIADPTLVGGAEFYSLGGNDSLTGTAYDDEFHVGVDSGFDTVAGGDGEDAIIADVNNATIGLTSISGVEKISGNGKTGVAINVNTGATIDLTNVEVEGIAQINGSSGIETITGSAGNDVIVGAAGNDVLKGGDGNDTLRGGAGNDNLDGGEGIDTYDASDVTANGTFTINATGSSQHTAGKGGNATTDTLTNIENIIAGIGADTLNGSALANVLDGGAGNDTINAGDGDDTLIGGAGTDILKGGAGDDTVSYATMATAFATPTVDSASGISINGVRADLKVNSSINGSTAPSTEASQGDAANDWFYQVENLAGSNFNDLLTGDDGANKLAGGSGNDALYGGLGDDELTGGAGDDYLDGQGGNSNVAAFEGNYADYVIATGATTTVTGIGARASDGVDRLRNINQLKFADVTISLGVSTNNAPLLGEPKMEDRTWEDGKPSTYQIPATSFIDLDISGNGATVDQMALSAAMADGSALPAWLSFDPVTRTFNGTPPLAAVGTSLDIKVTATDSGFAISDNFVLTISMAKGADINGTAGVDTLNGTFRDETMIGLAGNDVFAGSAGADRIDGGADTDLVDYAASASGVTVNLATGAGSGGDAQGDTLIAIEQAYGSAFDDSLTGSAGADLIKGQDGADSIDAGAGDDMVHGGAGTDTLLGGIGNDVIYARASSDGSLEDEIDGGNGIDELRLTESAYGATVDLSNEGNSPASIEHVVGSDFADTITGNEYSNILSGGLGNDALSGGAGADNLSGSGGNDSLSGEDGNDTLRGEVGDDRLAGGAGADMLYGGDGVDTIDYATSQAGVSVNLATSALSGGDAQGDVIADGSVENVEGSAYVDTLVGSAGINWILGGGGVDTINAGAGADTVRGGDAGDFIYGEAGNDLIHGDGAGSGTASGDDTIYGGDGNDIIYGEGGNDLLIGEVGADSIYGGGGDDTIRALVVGEDTINGELGVDTVDFGAATAGLNIDLNNAAHKLTSIENVTGGSGNDTITGNVGSNRIDGGSGNDVISGGAGADALIGGLGTDTLSYANSAVGTTFQSGPIGASVVNGATIVAAVDRTLNGVDVNLAAGTAARADASGDTISGFENLDGSAHADRLRGTASSSQLHGNGGDDAIYGGAGNDTLYGDDGNDILYGEDGVDSLFGGNGDDRLFGGGATDTLYGGAGNDLLDAGDAGDTLVGDGGNDTMVGGLGADVYRISRDSGADVIYNYDDDSALDEVFYADVDYTELWFTKVGKDLVVKVLGTTTATTIKDWFVNATAGDWTAADNFYVDMVIAGARATQQVNLAALLTISSSTSEPASYNDLTATQKTQIETAWGQNEVPTIAAVAGNPTSVNEDGSINLRFAVGDPDGVPANVSLVVLTDGVLQTIQAGDIRVIDATTREVTIRPAADASGTGNVRVRAFDQALYSNELVVPISVTPVADGVSLSVPSLVSGSGGSTINLTGFLANLIDNDGSEVFDYLYIEGLPVGATLASGANSSTSATTNIAGWNLSALTVTPAVGSADFTLTVRARSRETSNAAVSTQITQTISVDVSSAPTSLTVTPVAFNENVAQAHVAIMSATDPDSGSTFTYSIDGGADAAKFEIIGNNLYLKAGQSLNYEAGPAVINLRVTDQSGLYFVRTGVQIVATNVNEAPTNLVDTNGAANQLSDGNGAGTSGNVTIQATDPEGGTLSYSIVQDTLNWFAINSSTGVITVRSGAVINYESTSNGSYTINVQASDGTNTPQTSVVFNITDVNEAPVITSDAVAAISETAGVGSTVDTVTSSDPDNNGIAFGEAGHRYSIIGGTGASYFAINATSGVITTATSGAVFDYDAGVRSYTLAVRVRDNNNTGIWTDQTITINISAVQENPTPPAEFSANINENWNGTILTIGGSTDPEGEAVTYSFDGSGGNPGGLFNITPSGQLSLVSPLNYESRPAAFANGYADIRVVATTATGVSTVRTGRITLLNVNEAPTAPSNPTTGSKAENSTGYAGITFSGSTDPEGDAISYRFAGGATTSGKFSIVNGNQLHVTSAFDREAQSSASVVVYAYANGQLSATGVTAVINITNVDDNLPTGTGITMQNGYTTTIAENSVLPTTVIARAGANDADGDGLTYSIIAGNGSGVFSIDSSGNIRVPGGLNYEGLGGTNGMGVNTPLSLTLTIRAAQANNSGRYVDQSVTLSITDIVENQLIYSGSVTYPRSATANDPYVSPLNHDATYDLPGNYLWQESFRFNFSTGYSHHYKQIILDNNNDGAYNTGDTVLHRTIYDGPVAAVSTTGYRWEGDQFVGEYLKELPPIVLDLNGSGIHGSTITVEFDVDGDGDKDSTGWISGGQGFLALDRNSNGLIDSGAEISFMGDLPGARTDLEGLSAFDSNGDGVFNANDARFGEFLIWQDRDEDGVSDAGELVSLLSAGITGVGLTITPVLPLDEGNQSILGLSTFTRADGSTDAVGDVALRWDEIAQTASAASSTSTLNATSATTSTTTTTLNSTSTSTAAQPLPFGGRLAIDDNQNGIIEPATEAMTIPTAIERFDSDNDDLITPEDERYFDLRLWVDTNHNGSAELIELKGLDAAGLTSIGLDSEPPAVPPPPDLDFAATRYTGKAGKYRLATRGGMMFLDYRGKKAVIDPRAGQLGGATILKFRNKTVGLLAPIVIDLDGDGLDLVSRKKSHTRFDMDGDGRVDRTGWVGRGDGLLVIDRNNDGLITGASEISFLTDDPQATSDLDALTALDSNNDGKLTSADARFGELKIWVDANRNGRSDTGELKTLADHGIVEFGLTGRATEESAKLGKNVVLATATFKRADATVGTIGDVALAFSPSSKQSALSRAPGSRLAEVLAANDTRFAAFRDALDLGFSDAPSGDGTADTTIPAADPARARLLQMVQVMSTFGATSGTSELLRRQVTVDSGLDWYASSAA